MNPQTQQDDKQGHETAANLAFSTSLSQMLQGNHPSQTSQEPQNAPEQEQNQAPQEDTNSKLEGLESRVMDEIKGIKDMIEQNTPKDKNKELEDLKKEIKSVLESDE